MKQKPKSRGLGISVPLGRRRCQPAESRLTSVEPLLASPLFPEVKYYRFCYRQKLNLEGLIGRANSVSYIPKEPQAQQQLMSGLQELYDSYCHQNGFVYIAYNTSVYLATKNGGEIGSQR